MRYHEIVLERANRTDHSTLADGGNALFEGRVYRIDGGYPEPVTVVSNPSPPQARTLVKAVAAKRGKAVYFRAIMYDQKVYVWDGYLLTHDDVCRELLPDVPTSSDDLCAFEITNYRVIGLTQIENHPAKCIVLKPGQGLHPDRSPFVRNMMVALDALSPEQ